MSEKEQAVLDIQEELSKNSKSFIAFRVELNPVMDKLVKRHLKSQHSLRYRTVPRSRFHSNAQIMARCFFSKSGLQYDNYVKYYRQ